MIEYSHNVRRVLLFIMEWIYKYISWGAIIAGSITGIGFLIKYLIQKKIDSYFTKKIETYKQELAIITENAKYDMSKKLFDFEAYASKKHEVYPELYRAAFEPWDRLSNFKFIIERNSGDIELDLDDGSLEIRFDEEFMPIMRGLVIAYDYFYMNELYLSENTAKAYRETLEVLQELARRTHEIFYNFYANIADINEHTYTYILENDGEDKVKAEEKIQILKGVIYKELSYTHSE